MPDKGRYSSASLAVFGIIETTHFSLNGDGGRICSSRLRLSQRRERCPFVESRTSTNPQSATFECREFTLQQNESTRLAFGTTGDRCLCGSWDSLGSIIHVELSQPTAKRK